MRIRLQFALTAVAALLLAGPAAAADGVVLNQTTGKPQVGATVTLYKLGQAGPEALESVKTGPDGKWVIGQALDGMGFVQTAFEGVTYTQMIRPGISTTGMQLQVFKSSNAMGGVKVTDHMVLLQPEGEKLSVRETYFFLNEGKLTWNDPENGTLRFFVQAEPIGRVDVNAQGPGSMPLRRAADKGKEPGEMKLDFPIKPGETRIDLTYTLPFSDPGQFKTRFPLTAARTMLAVPNGVEVKGTGVKFQEKEPTTQAGIYGVEKNELDLTLSGSIAPATSSEEGNSGAPGIDLIKARPYDKLPLVLGLSFAVLAVGFAILYRSEPSVRSAAKSSGTKK